MPNIWYNKEYVQCFDCGTIYLKKAINMFERMKISEGIFEGVVTPSYKKILGHKQTILDSVVIKEEKPTRQIINLQRTGALASSVNDM